LLDRSKVRDAVGRVVSERRKAAVPARLGHGDRIGGACLAAREHQVCSIDAGDDRCSDARIADGTVDGVADLRERVMGVVDDYIDRAGAELERQCAGPDNRVSRGKRL